MIDKFAASFLINSALYIVGMFVAGLVWDNHLASLLALATAACALASADMAVAGWRIPAGILGGASWAVAIVAFGALIVP